MQSRPTRTDRRSRWSLSAALCASVLLLGSSFPARAQQAGTSSRERSGLADDQALLQRQLARLRQTMEILATRFEAEGRTHAAKLLRDGLAQLGARSTEQGSKTIDELMGGARSSLDSGQTVQAVEVQESVVKSLEKLYAILTDRQGLDDLEHSLDALKKLQAELSTLADQEKELHAKTDALEQRNASPERQALEQEIQKAIDAQRALLGKTEARARESGEMELEAIARELDALAARQATDRAVLESWKPEERSALEAAAPALEGAAERAAAAQRLAQAARELRQAAAAARDASGDVAAAQRDLESAAAREERREKAAGESDARASKALRTGAQALARAPANAAGREEAARTAEEQAAALEKAAEAELAAAREQHQAADASLAAAAAKKSAAGDVAQRARAALAAGAKPDGGAASGEKSVEARAEAEAKAAADAGRTLSAGLDEQATLPKALSASQAGAAEDAQRLARALEARPEGQAGPGSEAKKDLADAAEAQKGAAESAAKGDAEQAAAAARDAEQRLAAAREALARARASGAAGAPKTDAERALAREQEALAKALEALEQKAGSDGKSGADATAAPPQPGGAQSSPSGAQSPPSGAKSSLSAAKSAMQSAAKSLDQGSSAAAAGKQREAIERLEEAADTARKSGPLTKPEDRATAGELAKEQERIKNELLELAKRNQKRETAKPSPTLSQAGASAAKAKEALDAGETDEAQQSEENAERKMREAMQELSEEEEQYQKLRAEELLFKVAEQVKAMLDGHRELMKETLEIDAARKPGDPATHTQRLRLRKVAKSEEGFAARAAEVEKAIRAEESLVFAEVLDEAGRDLLRVARDLGDEGGYQSGDRVQALQQDVEQGLAWLYDALQVEKERRRQEQQSQQGNSQSKGKNRLVPDASELKLLRQLEIENLDSLEKFKAAHPEIPEGRETDPLLLEDLSRLANRHQRTSDLFEKFRKRLGLPDPPSQEP